MYNITSRKSKVRASLTGCRVELTRVRASRACKEVPNLSRASAAHCEARYAGASWRLHWTITQPWEVRFAYAHVWSSSKAQ